MQYLFCLIIILLGSISLHAQLLEGKWEGSYSEKARGISGRQVNPIELEFVNINNSSYQVYSYSNGINSYGHKTRITAKVYYELFSRDSIYLEELEGTDPGYPTNVCLQKMYLKITHTRKGVVLKGRWVSEGEGCESLGTVSFRRKKSR